jgi:hypothetical protein
MHDELGRRGYGPISYYPSVGLEGPWKTMKNVRIAGVLARISSKHLLVKCL